MNLKVVTINALTIYWSTILVVLWLRVCTAYQSCNVDMCSREYSSVLEVSQQWSQSMSSRESGQQYCSLLNAYQHCLRSIGRSCRGNLEFHTLQTLLKNWKHEHNCTQTSQTSSNHPFNKLVPTAQVLRSGPSGSALNTQWQHENRQKIVEQQERLQWCLSSAYNYTINTNHSANPSFRMSDQRTKLLSEANSSPTSGQRSRNRHRKDRLSRSAKSETPVKTNFFSIRGETIELKEEIDTNEFDSNTMASTVSTIKPSVPPSPPLTCIIFGDPHLRTFNNVYQTCQCSGAWPLIEHPLFAVQITNSKLKGANSPQITGVTKVTVLVRQFAKCGIHSDLTYEADSQMGAGGQSSGSPSSTFIDGSTSNSNNLIRITQSSNNNVITIHLDHIGVRVYIGQFDGSSYLNVVIKFRSATSTVKQQLVLNSISSNSLCKMGCPKREQIDIRHILSATGVDVSATSAQQSDNSVNNDYRPDPSLDMTEESEAVLGQEEVVSEPCADLNGYYRISCLYDVTIKGVKAVNNANRFAQSFDEMKFIDLSIGQSLVNSSEDNSDSHSNHSSHVPQLNHWFYIFMVFVTNLIINRL